MARRGMPASKKHFFFGLAEARHLIEAWRQDPTTGHTAVWVLWPGAIHQPQGGGPPEQLRLRRPPLCSTAPPGAKLQPRTLLINAPTLGAHHFGLEVTKHQ